MDVIDANQFLQAVFTDTSIFKNSAILIEGLETEQFENFRQNFSIPDKVTLLDNKTLQILFKRISKLQSNEMAIIKYIGGNTVFYNNLKSSTNFYNLCKSNILQEESIWQIQPEKKLLINGILDFTKIDSTFYYITSPSKSFYRFDNKNTRIVVDSLTYLNSFNSFIEDVNDSLKKINTAAEAVNLYNSYIRPMGIKNFTYDKLYLVNNEVYVFGTLSYALNAPSGHINYASRKFITTPNSQNKSFQFLKQYRANKFIVPAEGYGNYIDSTLTITPYFVNKSATTSSKYLMNISYVLRNNIWVPEGNDSTNLDTSYFTIYKKDLKDLIFKKNYLSKNAWSFTYIPMTYIKERLYLNYGFNDTLFRKMGYTNYLSFFKYGSHGKTIISIENYYGNILLIEKQITNEGFIVTKVLKLPVEYLKNPVFNYNGNDIFCAYYDKNIIIKKFRIFN